MYIEKQGQKNSINANMRHDDARERKIDNFLYGSNEKPLLEPAEEKMIPEHSTDVLAHWKAPEFEEYERDRKWYIWITVILGAIVVWALYSDSLIMAITFILIGMVGYIYIQKEPRILDFILTYDGVVAGKEMYDFDNIESFWIFYEPPHMKILSLKNKSYLLPYVHIPIHEEDPVHIREILLDFLPEKKQEEGMMEVMERLLRL